MSFSSWGLECKSGKSRDTWSKKQVWTWSKKWSRAMTNIFLPRKHTGHNKHHLPTTQEMILHVDITDGQYWNQIDYILCSQRWRSSKQSAKTRLGADCGSEHELLIAKFRPRLKKVGKTTRPFRYELNQIPHHYIVEVTNRFKGLDLIDCMKNYGQRFITFFRRWQSKPSSRKRKEKMQNGCLRRPYK